MLVVLLLFFGVGGSFCGGFCGCVVVVMILVVVVLMVVKGSIGVPVEIVDCISYLSL